MKDFTIETYKALLTSLSDEKVNFLRCDEFFAGRPVIGKVVLLRHDVDARKENSLAFARIQSEMGIKGTYYFRVIPQSYDEAVIKEIHERGHEIGYHYETMDTSRGNVQAAYEEFCRELEKFRRVVPVSTVCMHGSPLSKFDNREIWKHYDYRSLGIIAEPYFDLNFNETYYLTDTGRCWDGQKVSVRDKAASFNQCTNLDFINRAYHSTFDIISDIRTNKLPMQVMMNFHPQRWTDNVVEWYTEYYLQNVKNQIKRLLIAVR
jgi:hypothetical protein